MPWPRRSGPTPAVDVATAVTELSVGEALVSVLDATGAPTPVERAWIIPPHGHIGAITPEQRAAIRVGSPVGTKYDTDAGPRQRVREAQRGSCGSCGTARGACSPWRRPLPRPLPHLHRLPRRARLRPQPHPATPQACPCQARRLRRQATPQASPPPARPRRRRLRRPRAAASAVPREPLGRCRRRAARRVRQERATLVRHAGGPRGQPRAARRDEALVANWRLQSSSASQGGQRSAPGPILR